VVLEDRQAHEDYCSGYAVAASHTDLVEALGCHIDREAKAAVLDQKQSLEVMEAYRRTYWNRLQTFAAPPVFQKSPNSS
jgi:hypothetical protein